MSDPDYTQMTREQLIADNRRLRAKVREFAEACATCNGTGIDTDYFDADGREIAQGDPRRATGRPVTRDCEDCGDIRELL